MLSALNFGGSLNALAVRCEWCNAAFGQYTYRYKGQVDAVCAEISERCFLPMTILLDLCFSMCGEQVGPEGMGYGEVTSVLLATP